MRKLNNREIALILIAVGLSIIAGLNFYLQRTKKEVAVFKVARGNLESTIKVSGLVDSEYSEKVISNVEGIVSELKLKEGDRVKIGEKLCAIRSPALREKILQLEAELALIERDVRSDRNGSFLARYKFLKANIADLKAAAEPAAYIDGEIIDLNVKNGEKILPGTLLFVLADMQRPIVKARLDEADVPQVRAGQLAVVSGDFLGSQVLPGKVLKISSLVSRDVTTYVETWVKIFNPQKLPIKFGAYAEARLITGKKTAVLVIPRGAVMIEGNDNYVFVAEGGRARRRKIELGIAGENYVEIISGIKEGERVITLGNQDLKDGDRIYVR
jgi:RND family efflux transporter MFP subunit